ncbi:MAG: hypothetical protein ACJ746_21285 [Bryobacteraceae bacterium]
MSVISTANPFEPKLSSFGGVKRPCVAPILYICLLVAACKLAFYIADPYPSFHFGDSGAYLATALLKWIPPDRSFTYGFLLRPLVLRTHSFGPVLAIQILASGLASVVLGILLLCYFRAKPLVASVFACLCAVEPLQLMSERFVMTEAIATFGFAMYLWTAFSFIRFKRISTLIGVQMLGVALVSLRYSFLPLVLLLSVALPVLAFYKRPRISWRPLLLRLVVSVVAGQFLLSGYRHLYGTLAQTKPAYLSRDGEFLLADMAPIITPQDFPVPGERAELFQRIRIPLNDINNRPFHRWGELGLCQALLAVSHQDEDLANSLARRTALRAMRRDPLGVVALGFRTYMQFLTYQKLSWALKLNQGHFNGPTYKDIDMIRRWFGVDALDRKYESITKNWQSVAVPWCWLIVLLPWLYAAEMFWHRDQVSRLDWVLLLSALCTLGCAIVPVENPNPRYLFPLPWLSILILGVMTCRLYSKPSEVARR